MTTEKIMLSRRQKQWLIDHLAKKQLTHAEIAHHFYRLWKRKITVNDIINCETNWKRLLETKRQELLKDIFLENPITDLSVQLSYYQNILDMCMGYKPVKKGEAGQEKEEYVFTPNIAIKVIEQVTKLISPAKETPNNSIRKLSQTLMESQKDYHEQFEL